MYIWTTPKNNWNIPHVHPSYLALHLEAHIIMCPYVIVFTYN